MQKREKNNQNCDWSTKLNSYFVNRFNETGTGQSFISFI